MITRFLAFLRTTGSYIWLVALAVYFGVITGQSVLRNYNSQQETNQLNAQLQAAEQERDHLKALVVYYNTDNYKEKALRRELLLKLPNETAYALPESSNEDSSLLTSDGIEPTSVTAPKVDTRQNAPYWRQWIDYLLHGNRSA